MPANTTHATSAGPMLDQRRRRWANIGPALVQRLVFAGETRGRKMLMAQRHSVGVILNYSY